jgi:biopolymer transport protein ExbD
MRLALALLATLLIAAPAQAAATKVTWPEARAYGAGEQIAISVKGDRKVKVSVLRVSASGKVMSSVVRRTLKRGSVTATLARAGTYAVRVDRRERTLKVVAASSPAPEPPATPPQFNCVHAGSVTLEATLGADRVQRGQTLPFSIRNTSDGCVTTGVGYQLEYQAGDGQWKPVPWPLIFPMIAVILQQGGVYPNSVHIPADAPLGLYRLVGYTGFTEPTFEVIA